MADSTDGRLLPVAGPARVRRATAGLIRADLGAFLATLLLNGAAAAAALAGPLLLGRIVDEVRAGAGVQTVDVLALATLGFVVLRLVLVRFASYLAHRFGERALARIREQLVDRTLGLPSAVVERAGTGDLTARGTTDVTLVGTTVRDVVPDVAIALVQALFILVAVVVIDPRLGACTLTGLVCMWFAARWYMRRAPAGYLAEGAASSVMTEQLAATVAGARTVELFGLQQQRIAACEAAVDTSQSARLYTLWLRSVMFPIVDVAYFLPVVGVLIVGGVLVGAGAVTVGAVVSTALYLRQLTEPLDTLLERLDQLQSGSASFARVEGLAQAPQVAAGSAEVPVDDHIEVSGVHYAYAGGEDVLHGVDLRVRPGERLALVGPSGAGKSTLSRLLAGVDVPRAGSVTVGGVPIADLDPHLLRQQVVLVTQEHHVFLGTVRDNLAMAAPDASDAELLAALSAVGADWAAELPAALDTELGAADMVIDGSQAQQLALARVVLADPHTLVLDEATALLDPRTARHTERALAAVMRGRTVIAVAHRLHTAHDADRVAVMEDGRLSEIGTHDELVAAGGAYAALWGSWHGRRELPNAGA